MPDDNRELERAKGYYTARMNISSSAGTREMGRVQHEYDATRRKIGRLKRQFRRTTRE